MSCIFCKIVQGSIPCYKVYETKFTLAFLDINPLSMGHILVIPKTHSEFLHEVPDEELADVLPAMKRLASVSLQGVAYNVLQNNGQLAHQEVPHAHFHLIPKRTEEEGLGVQWPISHLTKEELQGFAESLRAKLSRP